MRRILAGGALLAWIACADGLFVVTVEESASTRVPAATPLELLLADVGFGDFVSMDLTASQEIRNQGVEPGDIREARLVTFELRAPEGADLAFLDRMELFVEGPDLPRQRVAHQADFPEGQRVVAFEVEPVDLTDYVVSEALTLTTEVEGRRPDRAVDIEAAFAVDVGVTTRGACRAARD